MKKIDWGMVIIALFCFAWTLVILFLIYSFLMDMGF